MASADNRIEHIGGGISVCVSKRHPFGTDSFLLSDFASPRRSETACDLGTGCGIVPLLWFRGDDAPKSAWAVDIQEEAVTLLGRSVTLSGLTGRLTPIRADLRALQGSLPHGGADLVTCNPPYYPAGSGQPSAGESDRIARHETMCTVDDVCAAAGYLLKYGGRLCLCHLPERLTDVLTAMRAHGIEPKRLRLVQQNAGDAPWLILAEGKRGAKPSLKVLPPLIMRENGGASPEMARIYRLYGKI